MATYTAKIKSKGEVAHGTTVTVTIEVSKDGVFVQEVELDVKAESSEDAIRQYLISYKEAQEAVDAIEVGKVISL